MPQLSSLYSRTTWISSRFSRFKTEFYEHIHALFDPLVDRVNPICLEMNTQKATQFSYDTTGLEGYVQENNPKYLNGIIRRLKYAMRFFDNATEFDPYKVAYQQMPPHAAVNPEFAQQYINGKFCYALRCGILTNGFGLPVAFEFFDQEFKDRHPEIPIEKKTNVPDEDKSLGDTRTLEPVLWQFVQDHPDMPLHTFLGDAAFDSLHCYDLLLNHLHFKRAVIPLNGRSSNDLPALPVNESGQPLCPKDPTLPVKYEGVLREKSGLVKQKWVCPKMVWKGKSQPACVLIPVPINHRGVCTIPTISSNCACFPVSFAILRNFSNFTNTVPALSTASAISR